MLEKIGLIVSCTGLALVFIGFLLAVLDSGL